VALALLSAPLLGQRIRPRALLGLGISLAGVYVIATRGRLGAARFGDPLGVGLALGSSVVWALYWIFHVRDPQDEVLKLSRSFLAGFALVVAAGGLTGELRAPSLRGALGAAYVGLFEMGVTFVLWLKALARSRTTAQVANLILLAPFLSLFLLHIAAGEQIHVSSAAGLALIVAGIALQRRF
jgi:drug/metabolite transporter (DMT)-like permease